MSHRKLTALVLGANGLVGQMVIDFLLKIDNYQTVYAVSRKGIDNQHPKIRQILADKDSITSKIERLNIDHLFSCIGSTKQKTPDINEYYEIDLHYPIQVASILKNNGCEAVCLVSSIGANSNAKNTYLKLKGDAEKSMISIGINSTNIFQPSLLMGNRNESRPLERISQFLSPIFNFFMIGPLKNYKSIAASKVASAMVKVALQSKKGIHIFKSQAIKEIA